MWFPFTVLLARRNNIAKEEIKTDVQCHIKKRKTKKEKEIKENNSGELKETQSRKVYIALAKAKGFQIMIRAR